MDARIIGQKIKEKSGAYENISDEVLGQKYLSKYKWINSINDIQGQTGQQQSGQSGQLSYNESSGTELEKLLASLTAPITQGPGGNYSHKGVTAWDYGVPEGTPLKAETDISTEYMPNQGIYGNRILIKLPNGKKYYLSHVSGGQSGVYKAGQEYGRTGNTGKSTGPHLEIAPG